MTSLVLPPKGKKKLYGKILGVHMYNFLDGEPVAFWQISEGILIDKMVNSLLLYQRVRYWAFTDIFLRVYHSSIN